MSTPLPYVRYWYPAFSLDCIAQKIGYPTNIAAGYHLLYSLNSSPIGLTRVMKAHRKM